jgi:hypothetical protein
MSMGGGDVYKARKFAPDGILVLGSLEFTILPHGLPSVDVATAVVVRPAASPLFEH